MTSIGILYNAFVCLVIGITGLVVFFALQKRRRKREVNYHEGVDYFCFLLGLMWLFVSVRFFLLWAGYHQASLFIVKWVTAPLTFLHLIPGFYYLGGIFFKNKQVLRWFFDGFFTFVALVAVFYFFQYGFQESDLTYWGSKIKYNPQATSIFTFGVFVPGLLGVSIELIRRAKKWKETGTFREKQLLGFNFGFFIYAATGVFARVLFTQGWKMLLVRVGIMVAILVLYFFATLKED